MIVAVAIFARSGQSPTPANPAAAPAVAALSAEQFVAERCVAERQAKEAQAWKHAEQGKYWDAYLALSNCLGAIKDPAFQALAQAFESQDYVQTLKDPKAKAKDKVVAYERLSGINPEKAAPFKAQAASYQRASEAEEKAAERRLAAERRKQGVSIGMTQEDVLASSWGKPEHINATHRSRGTREQWGYTGGGSISTSKTAS